MRQLSAAAIVIASMITAADSAAQPDPVSGTVPPTAAGIAVIGHPDPLSLLAHEDPVLARNKQLVFDMWRSIVNGGHVELADEMLIEGYTQHSPVLPTGREAFKRIFSAVPRLDEIPELVQPPLIALVAEGPYVVMALAETVAAPDGSGSYTTTHFNLFRVESGRLAEHWHSVQTPPGADVALPSEGGPQPVTGTVGIGQHALLDAANPALAANKRLVFDAWRQIVAAGRDELAALYLADRFVDHSVYAPTFGAPIATPYAAATERPIDVALADPIVAVVAEGDLVVQVLGQEHAHPARPGTTYTTTWFDMFRVADGRLTEHWDPALMAAADPVVSTETDAGCAPDDGLAYICGLANAEDLVRIGASNWLVASSITTRGDAVGAGRLYLVDADARTAAELFPGPDPVFRRDAETFGDCSIDLGAFDTHGLAITNAGPGRYRLYATSHGIC
jgi:predicted SnoaL-like aldol condensation-catalyzing enzyme